MTTYLVSGFDAKHNWLDTDPENRGEGYPTEIDGAGVMLEFIGATRTGVLHNWDTETHAAKRVAYWVVSVGGIPREVYVTGWGKQCRTRIPGQGPGCRQPVDVPRHI